MLPPAVLAILFLSCFLDAADARGFVSEASKEKLRAMTPAEKRKIVGIALGIGFPALFAFIFLMYKLRQRWLRQEREAHERSTSMSETTLVGVDARSKDGKEYPEDG